MWISCRSFLGLSVLYQVAWSFFFFPYKWNAVREGRTKHWYYFMPATAWCASIWKTLQCVWTTRCISKELLIAQLSSHSSCAPGEIWGLAVWNGYFESPPQKWPLEIYLQYLLPTKKSIPALWRIISCHCHKHCFLPLYKQWPGMNVLSSQMAEGNWKGFWSLVPGKTLWKGKWN